MTAYVIVDIEVTDPEGYKEYVKLAPEAVNLYGGKYIARGGPNETLEGNWQAKRLVILEFPLWSKRKRGSTLPNTRQHASYAINTRGQTWLS